MKNNKKLGQHWLKNREILEEIADFAAGFDSNATLETLESPLSHLCLEIGPGLGTLTSSLLRRFDKVVAVEFDQNLAKNLPKSFPGKNLEVICQDFLKFNLESLSGPYVVAGNIPYYITSPIIFKLIEAKKRPQRIVLLIQKEVAERIAAGKGKHTVLSLSVQNRAKVALGPVVLKSEFTPPPEVDSQVIILEPLERPVVSEEVIALIKRGFSSPRKKLIKNLGTISTEELKNIFEKIGLNLDVRPAELSLLEWQELQRELTRVTKR